MQDAINMVTGVVLHQGKIANVYSKEEQSEIDFTNHGKI